MQHTTVGSGMWHSEINNRPDEPMRFIQMWFSPGEWDLRPAVEQKAVERDDRRNLFLRLVGKGPNALPIRAGAKVFASFLERGHEAKIGIPQGWGGYLYVLEGGPVAVNDRAVPTLGAAQVSDESTLRVVADQDAELLLVRAALH